MRNRNTTSSGGSWSPLYVATIWSKGIAIAGYDPTKYRQDSFGVWMARSEYGQTTQFGWEVDHIRPVARGGGDELSNLQPLHWKSNRLKADT